MSLRLARSLACLSSCGALVALSAGTSHAATPSAKLRSISSPPKTALAPGATLTVSGGSPTRRAGSAKARVTLTLRTTQDRRARSRSAPRARPASRPGRTARYIARRSSCPRRWPTARYYLRGCARVGSRRVELPLRHAQAEGRQAQAARRHPRRRPRPAPPRPPAPLPAPSPETGPKFDVLVFTGAAPPALRAGVDALKDVAKDGGFKVTAERGRVAVHRRAARRTSAPWCCSATSARRSTRRRRPRSRPTTRTAAACSRSARRSSPSRSGAT